MSNTEATEVVFTVKEAGDGTPWLMLEPRRKKLAVLGNGFLGLRLRPGTTYEEATQISNFLDQHIASIAYTRL